MKHHSFGSKSKEKLNGVSEELIAVCELALSESNYDFSIIDGVRTLEEQTELFVNGKSEADGINIISAHQEGKAVDVYPYVEDENGSLMNCWNYNDPKVQVVWYEIHRSFLRASRLLGFQIELGLTYNIGGSYDYPHIEIKGV